MYPSGFKVKDFKMRLNENNKNHKYLKNDCNI